MFHKDFTGTGRIDLNRDNVEFTVGKVLLECLHNIGCELLEEKLTDVVMHIRVARNDPSYPYDRPAIVTVSGEIFTRDAQPDFNALWTAETFRLK